MAALNIVALLVGLSAASPWGALLPRTLSKPTISPEFDLDGKMEAQLRSVLPQHSFRVTQWPSGFVPSACKDEADYNGFKSTDFTVLNVTYNDCADPWVICRHKGTPVSQTNMLTRLGQIPVGMRQYLQNVIAFPPNENVAYTVGSYVAIFGDWWNIGTMAHEFAHVLDFAALQQYVPRPGTDVFSDTARWQTPQDRDPVLPTGYAASSWAEDFAESGRVGLTDMVVPGGLGSINANASQIANQVGTFEQYLRTAMFPGSGRCTMKARSTDPVPVSLVGRMGPPPDVSLSGAVPEIVVPGGTPRRFVYLLSAVQTT